MPSAYITDLIDHKQRVAGYSHKAAALLVERALYGDVLLYPERVEEATLFDVFDVACKLKRDGLASFALEGQIKDLATRTLDLWLLGQEGTSVAQWRGAAVLDLFQRAALHDNSKFSLEEFDAYEAAFPELQRYAYGSEEFAAALCKIQPALDHHYSVNDHHPQYFRDGVVGMHVVQQIEMICDWLAASERSQTPFSQGFEMNKNRFCIEDQLFAVLKNTVEEIAPEKLLLN